MSGARRKVQRHYYSNKHTAAATANPNTQATHKLIGTFIEARPKIEGEFPPPPLVGVVVPDPVVMLGDVALFGRAVDCNDHVTLTLESLV